ncbi:hypothetical protein MVES_001302 [Malassezia vespertilionis]|uniref:Uncharacterized protein n=1 Tax=Malassezia vespertilionis TaxID=2020962 RepID=A0A2N1JFE9_9BASI|nr:hypothetical protein MVES_001302 [Malassezia vespertilionis]
MASLAQRAVGTSARHARHYTYRAEATARIAFRGKLTHECIGMARGAGLVGAKHAFVAIPTCTPSAVEHVTVEIRESSASDEQQEPRELRAQTERAAHSTAGGFSAAALLDPDAWIADNTESSTGEAPLPSALRAPEVSPNTIHVACCVTSSTSAPKTHALAGCMQASLALFSILQHDPNGAPSIVSIHTT